MEAELQECSQVSPPEQRDGIFWDLLAVGVTRNVCNGEPKRMDRLGM